MRKFSAQTRCALCAYPMKREAYVAAGLVKEQRGGLSVAAVVVSTISVAGRVCHPSNLKAAIREGEKYLRATLDAT
jgi:hypothetical protein